MARGRGCLDRSGRGSPSWSGKLSPHPCHGACRTPTKGDLGVLDTLASVTDTFDPTFNIVTP